MIWSLELLGALAGAVLALGAGLAWTAAPWRRGPGLVARLAPYVSDVRPDSVDSEVGLPATLKRIFGPVRDDALGWVDRLSGGPIGVRRRLEQSGPRASLEEFRADQALWGVAGLAAGLVVAGVAAGVRGPSAMMMIVLVLVGGASGVLLRDRALTWSVRRRQDMMMAEFPTVAELLALSVAAGEGAAGALERVATTCSGELSTELRRTLADARAGAPLIEALEGLADRTGLPPLTRFVDGVTVAVERGTPLAEVLRAQAQDARELGRRRLMEVGGRKEIAMMVPVVFLVLPVTVVFAVFPGLLALRFQF
jgi:tight adherence protein C